VNAARTILIVKLYTVVQNILPDGIVKLLPILVREHTPLLTVIKVPVLDNVLESGNVSYKYFYE